MRCIEKVDQLRERGGDKDPTSGIYKPKASHDANGKSAAKTAAIVGVSQATVERARTALSDPEVAQEVKVGKMTINKGAQAVKTNRLISGSQVAVNLVPIGALCTPCEIQPTNEAQVRPALYFFAKIIN